METSSCASSVRRRDPLPVSGKGGRFTCGHRISCLPRRRSPELQGLRLVYFSQVIG